MKVFLKILAIISVAVCLMVSVKLAFEVFGSRNKKYIMIDR